MKKDKLLRDMLFRTENQIRENNIEGFVNCARSMESRVFGFVDGIRKSPKEPEGRWAKKIREKSCDDFKGR